MDTAKSTTLYAIRFCCSFRFVKIGFHLKIAAGFHFAITLIATFENTLQPCFYIHQNGKDISSGVIKL